MQYLTRWAETALAEYKSGTNWCNKSSILADKEFASHPMLTPRKQKNKKQKLVRQSQILQSVTQDCKYVLSNLVPVCNLLIEGQLLFVKTVLKFTVVFYVEFRSL